MKFFKNLGLLFIVSISISACGGILTGPVGSNEALIHPSGDAPNSNLPTFEGGDQNSAIPARENGFVDDNIDRDWVATLIRKDLNDVSSNTKVEDTASAEEGKINFEELEATFDGEVWRPGKSFDIPLTENEQVQKWVRIFTTTLRPKFELWLSRASRYAPLIEATLREKGLPTDLLYLSMIESGFNLNAYSRARAAGPWQFMSATGKMYGLNNNGYVDDRRDIEKSTAAAAAHLKDLYNNYNDWYLAFAAYNAGAGGVNRAIRKAGTDDFWKLSAPKTKYLHAETKEYVPRILAAAIISKNYKKYGLNVEFMEPLKFERVTVNDAVDMSALAQCAEVSVAQMQELNPALVMGMTPPGSTTSIYVPEGAATKFQENFASLPKEQRVQLARHKVRGKETLYTIAKRYGVSKEALAQANGLGLKSKMKVGSLLLVPKKTFVAATPVIAKPAVKRVATQATTKKIVHSVR